MSLPSRLSSQGGDTIEAETTVRLFASNVEIDASRQRVHVDGRAVRMTPIEWRVLSLLVARADRVVPMATLIEELSTPARPMTHTALVRHVCNLRQKIGHRSIETIRLSGVRLRVRPPG